VADSANRLDAHAARARKSKRRRVVRRYLANDVDIVSRAVLDHPFQQRATESPPLKIGTNEDAELGRAAVAITLSTHLADDFVDAARSLSYRDESDVAACRSSREQPLRRAFRPVCREAAPEIFSGRAREELRIRGCIAGVERANEKSFSSSLEDTVPACVIHELGPPREAAAMTAPPCSLMDDVGPRKYAFAA
jgi:hypothetical protein